MAEVNTVEITKGDGRPFVCFRQVRIYVRMIRMMADVVLISVPQVKQQVTQMKSMITAQQDAISPPPINFTLC